MTHPGCPAAEASEHLDKETMGALAEGRLASYEREEAVARLLVCESCRELMALSLDTLVEKCHHGNRHYCGLCAAEKSPKCKHGNASFCGLCLAEKGDGRVRGAGSGVVLSSPDLTIEERLP